MEEDVWEEKPGAEKPGPILIIFTMSAFIYNIVLSYIVAGTKDLESGSPIAVVLGNALIWPLIVVGFFQLSPACRNARIRIKFFLYTTLLIIFGNTAYLYQLGKVVTE